MGTGFIVSAPLICVPFVRIEEGGGNGVIFLFNQSIWQIWWRNSSLAVRYANKEAKKDGQKEKK